MTENNLSDIRNFENHPSIMKIEENINKNLKFSFSLVTREELEKEIKLLDTLSLSLLMTLLEKIKKKLVGQC